LRDRVRAATRMHPLGPKLEQLGFTTSVRSVAMEAPQRA
jgi:hypothetical protein